MKVCILASGSAGNAALVATEKTRVLVDAGLSMKELRRRLALIGEEIEDLDAIVISHEHSDHVGGLPVMARSRKVRASLHMTEATAAAVPWGDAAPARLETFPAGACFRVGDVEIQSFGVPHDAADPVNYCLAAEGVRVGIVTDLGHISDTVRFHLRRTDLLMLEANHDLDMLKIGPYPWTVKQRVMSRTGHLSNADMADFLAADLNSSTAHLVLGHLSQQNNHPEIARLTASHELELRRLATRLSIAEQDSPSEVFRF